MKGAAMRVTYFCSGGPADATRASIPFHLGVNGSAANGDDVSFILGGDASELMIGDRYQQVEGVGFPPLEELIGKVKDLGLQVYV